MGCGEDQAAGGFNANHDDEGRLSPLQKK